MLNLKNVRTEKGLSTSELAQKVGVSEVSIRKYESGERNPKGDTLRLIASALGVNVQDLFDTGNLERRIKSLSTMRDVELEKLGKDKILGEEWNAIVNRYGEKIGVLQTELNKERKAIAFYSGNPLLDWDTAVSLADTIEKENHVPTASEIHEQRDQLLEAYDSLNNDGKKEAFNLIKLFTQIPDFQKKYYSPEKRIRKKDSSNPDKNDNPE